MSLRTFLSLGNGISFHSFRRNPFHVAKPGLPSFLLPVKPLSAEPIRPILDMHHHGMASGQPELISSNPGKLQAQRTADSSAARSRRTEKIELLILRLLIVVLALACIGCGFGFQHIAYVKQKNELCRQLRQKETELRVVSQAYQSLESATAAQAAEEFLFTEPPPIITKHSPQKSPSRG